MNYLMDTCLLSEVRKNTPNPSVIEWISQCDENAMYISALSIGELQYGISQLPESHKKNGLIMWFNDLTDSFDGRILPVSHTVSILWGNTRARLKKQGIQLPVIDGLIAATAEVHSMTLVTRNSKDFKNTSVQLFNPWE